MKDRCFQKPRQNAFTFVELMVVIAIGALLAGLTLPALARARIKAPGEQCISNKRQMMIGWEMYKEDNNDNLMPNATAAMTDSSSWVSSRQPNWFTAVVNTNVAWVKDGQMSPYVDNDIRVFRCPADVIPSANGTRLRSVSMNSQMGYVGAENDNPAYLRYLKGSDITSPTPANAFVFCDESMWSMNDGYLQINMSAPSFPDVPANYHGNACGFSFADGHAEEHRWLNALLTVPYAWGVQRTSNVQWPSSVQDADWLWLSQHASSRRLP